MIYMPWLRVGSMQALIYVQRVLSACRPMVRYFAVYVHQEGGSDMHLPEIVYIYINVTSHDIQ